MGRLIKAEFIKLSKSLGYKVLLLCSAGMGILVTITSIVISAETNGINVYLAALVDSQVNMIYAGIFAGVFICGDFTNRTFGTSVFGGCTRVSLLLAKAVVFMAGLLPVFFAYPLVFAAATTIVNDFGELNAEVLSFLGRTTFLFIFGGAATGGLCFMLAMLIKNVGGTIGAGIGALIGLTIISQIPQLQPVMKFTFVYQLAQIAQPESLALYFVVIFATIVITMIASGIIFENSELK